MKSKEEVNIENYLKMLVELERVLNFTTKLHLSNFARSYKIKYYSEAVGQLIKGGILKNVGGEKRAAEYKWNTIPPNIVMAKELYDRARSRNITRFAERRELKSKEEAISKTTVVNPSDKTPVEKEIGETAPILTESVTKYLWGLIKIKTIYNY